MEFGKEIISILDYIGNKLGIAVDWSSQAMMPYVKDVITRIVQYEIATSIAWMVLAILFVLVIGMGTYKIKKKNCCYDARIWCNIFMIGAVLIATLVIMTQTFDIMRAINLPELTAYNYVKHITYQFKQ